VTVVGPSGMRINIPRELLGQTIPEVGTGATFLAEEPRSKERTTPRQTISVAAAGGSATVVRLKHSGNFDPEPLAFERFAHLLYTRANTSVNIEGPIPITDLPASGVKLAIMTGTGKLDLSAEELAAMKTFIEGGGTIFIDAGGGSSAFHNSLKKVLRGMYPKNQLKSLAMSSPIYNISGAIIGKARYRRNTLIRLGSSLPNLQAVIIDNRPVIIYSREDVTGGLVGYSSAAVDGYAPVSAFQIMRNVILFAGR